jgi:hypothetical protein
MRPSNVRYGSKTDAQTDRYLRNKEVPIVDGPTMVRVA